MKTSKEDSNPLSGITRTPHVVKKTTSVELNMRQILSASQIHPELLPQIEAYHSAIIEEIKDALDKHQVVVVGMAQNPFCKKAKKAMESSKHPFKYLEYGSYLGEWKPRLAIKMWAGWPTFPMVFVKGQLIGGFQELKGWLDEGKLEAALKP